MVEFFRDILDGPLYYVVVLIAIVLIMAIIGFIMERRQKEKQEKGKVAFVSREAKQHVENNSEVIPGTEVENNQ